LRLLAGTSVVQAGGADHGVLIGPVLAYKRCASAPPCRGLWLYAMCLGGLLVHFGRGPMQIEMHFYFFRADRAARGVRESIADRHGRP